jgi:pyruvate formate lyase activating enzyme
MAVVLDEFIVDIKDTDPMIYQSYTGRTNDSVLSNLARLIAVVGTDRITVRVPKIPHFNTDENRENSRRLLSEMGIVHFNFFDYIIR